MKKKKKQEVILVNEKNRIIGTEEKLKAHQNGGKLHRAFSVFIFNSKGELLIQKRSRKKYHSPGLWTNTCCSHPRPKERTGQAAKRRLEEEMGFVCNFKKAFSFIYKIDFSNGLSENEFELRNKRSDGFSGEMTKEGFDKLINDSRVKLHER